jgi:hypothetical protein
MVAMGRATHLRYFLLCMLLAMLLAGSGKCSVCSIGYRTGHFVNSVWLAWSLAGGERVEHRWLVRWS